MPENFGYGLAYQGEAKDYTALFSQRQLAGLAQRAARKKQLDDEFAKLSDVKVEGMLPIYTSEAKKKVADFSNWAYKEFVKDPAQGLHRIRSQKAQLEYALADLKTASEHADSQHRELLKTGSVNADAGQIGSVLYNPKLPVSAVSTLHNPALGIYADQNGRLDISMIPKTDPNKELLDMFSKDHDVRYGQRLDQTGNTYIDTTVEFASPEKRKAYEKGLLANEPAVRTLVAQYYKSGGQLAKGYGEDPSVTKQENERIVKEFVGSQSLEKETPRSRNTFVFKPAADKTTEPKVASAGVTVATNKKFVKDGDEDAVFKTKVNFYGGANLTNKINMDVSGIPFYSTRDPEDEDSMTEDIPLNKEISSSKVVVYNPKENRPIELSGERTMGGYYGDKEMGYNAGGKLYVDIKKADGFENKLGVLQKYNAVPFPIALSQETQLMGEKMPQRAGYSPYSPAVREIFRAKLKPNEFQKLTAENMQGMINAYKGLGLKAKAKVKGETPVKGVVYIDGNFNSYVLQNGELVRIVQ